MELSTQPRDGGTGRFTNIQLNSPSWQGSQQPSEVLAPQGTQRAPCEGSPEWSWAKFFS